MKIAQFLPKNGAGRLRVEPAPVEPVTPVLIACGGLPDDDTPPSEVGSGGPGVGLGGPGVGLAEGLTDPGVDACDALAAAP